MLTAASKARPAFTSSRSSFSASSSSSAKRASSTLAASDIFDAPGRLIFDDEVTTNASLDTKRRYLPSHFRPLPSQPSAHTRSSSAAPAAHQYQSNQKSQSHVHPAHGRQMSTPPHHRTSGDESSVLFDGPARPRHPPRVTSRHKYARASSSSASLPISPSPLNAFKGVDMKKYIPPTPLPEPLLFVEPARPRRKAPVQLKKPAHSGANTQSSAVVGAVAGLLGLGGAYELFEVQQSPQCAPRTILSFSRSRESLVSREPENDSEEDESKHEVLRDEVLPNIY